VNLPGRIKKSGATPVLIGWEKGGKKKLRLSSGQSGPVRDELFHHGRRKEEKLPPEALSTRDAERYGE